MARHNTGSIKLWMLNNVLDRYPENLVCVLDEVMVAQVNLKLCRLAMLCAVSSSEHPLIVKQGSTTPSITKC